MPSFPAVKPSRSVPSSIFVGAKDRENARGSSWIGGVIRSPFELGIVIINFPVAAGVSPFERAEIPLTMWIITLRKIIIIAYQAEQFALTTEGGPPADIPNHCANSSGHYDLIEALRTMDVLAHGIVEGGNGGDFGGPVFVPVDHLIYSS